MIQRLIHRPQGAPADVCKLAEASPWASSHLAFFMLATFAAALVAGLAGFAFGLLAAAVWLHILTPVQTASLIIAFGPIVQGVAVWKLRRALQWRRLWPFLLGGLLGVPLGVAVVGFANPDYMRAGVACCLSPTASTAWPGRR